MLPSAVFNRFIEEYPGMKGQIERFVTRKKSKLYKGSIVMLTKSGKNLIYTIKNDNTTTLTTKK